MAVLGQAVTWLVLTWGHSPSLLGRSLPLVIRPGVAFTRNVLAGGVPPQQPRGSVGPTGQSLELGGLGTRPARPSQVSDLTSECSGHLRWTPVTDIPPRTCLLCAEDMSVAKNVSLSRERTHFPVVLTRTLWVPSNRNLIQR